MEKKESILMLLAEKPAASIVRVEYDRPVH